MKERSFALAAWLYHRVLALVLGIAFASLAVQVRGLIGERGIVPLQPLLSHITARSAGFWQAPSVFWLDSSGQTLELVAWAGVVVAALLFLGVWPRVTALLGWALYLSFASVGDPFLSFQWDALLLEALLISPFLLPRGYFVSPLSAPEPPTLGLLLSRFLLFRLMLLSGMVKLGSGDPSWRDFTALTYHYWTQPLPAPTSWLASQLPLFVQQVSCALTLFIELALPFGIFLFGRTSRLAAAAGFVTLQLIIAATGNYGFFNLLTLGLCALLADDAVLERALGFLHTPAPAEPVPLAAYAAVPAAGLIALVATAHFAARVDLPVPPPLRWLSRQVEPLRSINAYGLFASMTRTRPEIEIEGSADGEIWKPYRFRYKPELETQPTWVQPHMPRLDWQMWFAALSSCRRQPWFLGLVDALLEGSPEVRALFAEAPFEGKPPRQIRTTLYEYHLASSEEHAATGAVWTRELQGEYCPTLELSPDGRLRKAPAPITDETGAAPPPASPAQPAPGSP